MDMLNGKKIYISRKIRQYSTDKKMDQRVAIKFKRGISKEIYQCINLTDSFIRNVKTVSKRQFF